MSRTPNGPVIKSLPQNTTGRDLIVGDIHGQKSKFDHVLKKAKFDPTKDRLLSVGDLVDRGPDNIECLKLLQEPWFTSVLGNHDFNCLMMVLLHSKQYHILEKIPGVDMGRSIKPPVANFLPWDPKEFGKNNGGEWMFSQLDTLEPFIKPLLAVPHVLKVGEEDRFHLVHACLHCTTNIAPKEASTDQFVDSNIWAERNPFWGTHQLLNHRPANWMGTEDDYCLSRTYCGHTIFPHITHFAKHTCLDTGAFRPNGRLTLFCHQTKEHWEAE